MEKRLSEKEAEAKMGSLETWRENPRIADYWHPADEAGRVECALCPRHCKPRDGQSGACRVRGNLGGQLHTFNYGKSVAATEEVIETEAVYHFSPGRRILSLGNIGCMMACDFCQNWKTSQVRQLDPGVVKSYTPDEILEICEKHGIRMISWTYNDPVVWHEFVRDTSRLAQRRGIRTLYKSAFYIEDAPARELIDCVDIFSLSLKSMSENFYRRITKGELAPVLERIKLIHRSGRHVEISQLLIPERNDALEDIRKTIRWVLDNVGDEVPLHFVGFHPAYKYTRVERTSVESLLQARDVARSAGIKYCYLGNVYREGVSDTHCGRCGQTLVARYGLTSSVVGITREGTCTACGRRAPIRFPFEGRATSAAALNRIHSETSETSERQCARFRWTPDVSSVHLTVSEGLTDDRGQPVEVTIRHLDSPRVRRCRLGEGLERVIVSRRADGDREILITWNAPRRVRILPVLDRAHFPVGGQDEHEEEALVENSRRSLPARAVT